MKAIRRFAFAAALTLSTTSFLPSLASGQEAHGKFDLAKDVHWQTVTVPAGEYAFSLQSRGPGQMLFLTKVNSPVTSFMMLVNDTSTLKSGTMSRLVLVSRAGASFVSTMELPNSEIALHFAVPSEGPEMAKAETTAGASSSR